MVAPKNTLNHFMAQDHRNQVAKPSIKSLRNSPHTRFYDIKKQYDVLSTTNEVVVPISKPSNTVFKMVKKSHRMG